MFWRFGGYANISTLDQVLDKPDVTLEELLDESDLIQELKAQNAKLIDFIRDDDRLETLLKYVVAPKGAEEEHGSTQASPPDEEKKEHTGFFSKRQGRSKSRDIESDYEKAERRRLKYAFVACEVLSSEVYSIYEAVMENTDALREFWKYIKQDTPLDATQAGYFTKVNEALLEKKTEDMIAFVKSVDNVVADMMKHVDCPMVMDLLLKLISLEKDPEGQGIVDWLQQQSLIPMLLDYISPEHSAATQTSAGDFLKAIITISANATGQDASVIGPNELTRQLVSDPCITRLCNEMLKGGNPLTVGVGIVIEVIRKNNSDYDSESQIGPEPKSTDPIYLGNLLRIFSRHVSDFMALILSRKHTALTEEGVKVVDRKDLKVAWGDTIEPLGFDRFKTCELMAELLHCSNMGLLNEKGSAAAIKSRDEERDRLKAAGELAAAPLPQHQTHNEFGHSVDSSGYHHAEDFTPLGESPEDIKQLEVQNNVEEEDFEKVAIPETEPDSIQGQYDSMSMLNEAIAGLTQSVKNIGLNKDAESSSDGEAMNTPTSSTSSKQRISLLSQQLKAEKSQKLNNAQDSNLAGPDVPPPLFASKSPATPQDTEMSQDSSEHIEDATIAEGTSGSQQAETQESSGLPIIETEEDGSPVVGDLLKMMFVEHRVVPTILDFFFRFPWNNFLHNVVYDVVQQVFNGSMDRGYNRHLAVDLFETGCITTRIIEGQERSDKAQRERKMRLGYMGHLTLIAEEVVKFTERQPPEMLAPQVIDRIMDPDWIHYVEHTLTETRDRDNAILGGVRPDASVGPRQAVLNAVAQGQGFGNTGTNALANAGLSGGGGSGLDSMDLANAGNSQYGGNTLLSGFGSSDDEDDEEMEDAGDAGRLNTDNTQGEQEYDKDSNDKDGGNNSNNAPTIPAPLAIPPSRARRQLAARLAEKQKRNAEADATSNVSNSNSSETAMAIDPGSSAVASTQASTHARRASGGEVAGDARSGGHEAGGMTEGHSSEDEIEDDEEDGMKPAPLKRQTTREALERKPLDVGDDEDEEHDDKSSNSELKTAEQSRLIKQWNIDSRRRSQQAVAIEEDSDSSDEEDKPVEMGFKSRMSRRSSSQGSQGSLGGSSSK